MALVDHGSMHSHIVTTQKGQVVVLLDAGRGWCLDDHSSFVDAAVTTGNKSAIGMLFKASQARCQRVRQKTIVSVQEDEITTPAFLKPCVSMVP